MNHKKSFSFNFEKQESKEIGRVSFGSVIVDLDFFRSSDMKLKHTVMKFRCEFGINLIILFETPSRPVEFLLLSFAFEVRICVFMSGELIFIEVPSNSTHCFSISDR